jgi:hypothetical protein
MKSKEEEAIKQIKELGQKLCAVCADARHRGMSFIQVFAALSSAILSVMRSCDCPDCRRKALRLVKRDLPNGLHEAVAYSIEKYAGHNGRC